MSQESMFAASQMERECIDVLYKKYKEYLEQLGLNIEVEKNRTRLYRADRIFGDDYRMVEHKLRKALIEEME